MSFRKLVRNAVLEIERGDENTAVDQAERVRSALHERGLEKNCHVGQTEEFLSVGDHTVEWYAGQLLDIVDNQAWFAMNSFINCVDKFCPDRD